MNLLKQLTELEQFGTVEHININSVLTVSMSGNFNPIVVDEILSFIKRHAKDDFPSLETLKVDTTKILIVLKP